MQIEGFSNVSQVLSTGVYVLVHRGEVVYVGQSKRILNRIYTHMSASRARKREQVPWLIAKQGIYYDEVHVRPTHPDQLDEVERALIELYKPRHNTAHKTPGPTKAPFSLVVGGVELEFNAPREPIARRI